MPEKTDRLSTAEGFAGALVAHGLVLLRIGRAVLGEVHLAEDAVAQTYLKAWARRGALRDAKKLGAWLKTICRREAQTIQRRRARDRAVPLDEATIARKDRRARTELLTRLPDALRVCAEMFFVEGRSYSEIASLTALPVSTIRGRIYQSRKTLRKELTMETESLIGVGVDKEATLRARDGKLKWGGATIRFLGISWTQSKTLYSASGKRLSRVPVVLKKSGLFGADDFDAPALALYWVFTGKVLCQMGANVRGQTTKTSCQPAHTRGAWVGRSRVLRFTCGAPGEEDVHVRPTGILLGGPIRDESPAMRFDLKHHYGVATSRPGWGALFIYPPRRGRSKGCCELPLAFSSPIAERGARVYGLDSEGNEIGPTSWLSADSSSPEGHLCGMSLSFPVTPGKLHGVVIYPRERASVDWGRIRIPPRPS